jgi:hypothetical protein
MTVPARRKPAPDTSYFDIDDDDAHETSFYAGERVCAPPDHARGSSLLPACIVIMIAAGGWWLLKNPGDWPEWLSTKIATASALMHDGTPLGPAPAMAPPQPASTPEPTPHTDTAPSQVQPPSETASITPPEPPVTTIATAPADKAPAVAPLPPPASNAGDRYQRRAASVGLHPDISRALLSRLSPTDYRNAGIAIETAVAKTPDSGTFVWPRQRKPELALFQVRFVPGAAPDCRRYVVTVTKDRWSTTALPMEKCGSSSAGRKTSQ